MIQIFWVGYFWLGLGRRIYDCTYNGLIRRDAARAVIVVVLESISLT